MALDCESTPIACQLERIADALSGFDVNSFAATLLATIIGAVVAALIGLVVARAERPQPFFSARAIENSGIYWDDAGIAHTRITVTNIGDGPAFNVSLTAEGFKDPAVPGREAKLEGGDSITVSVTAPYTGKQKYDPLGDSVEGEHRLEWPASASVVVRWQQPPARHKVREQRIRAENPQRPPG